MTLVSKPLAGFLAKSSAVSPISDVIADIRMGKIVILIDDEREHEGDFVVASSMVTEESMRFMIQRGSGIVCLVLPPERMQQLSLDRLLRRNAPSASTAQYMTPIDAAHNIGSGVSAKDRAVTILTAVNTNDPLRDLKTPGHVFPLMAAKGGVLERAGHTESSLALVIEAGLYPGAVICEVMNEKGDTASYEETCAIAQRHDIKVGLVRDVVEMCRASACVS